MLTLVTIQCYSYRCSHNSECFPTFNLSYTSIQRVTVVLVLCNNDLYYYLTVNCEYVQLLFIPAGVSCLPRVICLCRSSGLSLRFMALGSNCVYLQSHDLRMTPTGLSKEGREGHGL